ncbi:MAG: alpha-L-fucosidase [Clostridia bacterium]|nr:alpha-L-fucosidase [Clostridia bacterium]
MTDSRLELYTSITPSDVQKSIMRDGFNVFIHYGINTFCNKEWSDGSLPASAFNPTSQNTDEWIQIIKSAGAKGVILTCKHHDGFCLWQTDTTDYGVKSSPYKGGKGDVVQEVSDSCRKYGLKFGVYLSPWDRNSPTYGTDSYNDFYIAQLTELLTRYGKIFCVWLDGACGSYLDGKPKQVYDFKRYYDTIRALQPDCCISNCGPDVRWVGNEAGCARESEWNVVPSFSFDIQTIEDNSQQSDDDASRLKGIDIVAQDLGSRQVLSRYDKFIWYPAEVDVSIRPGWFYHKSQNMSVRSLDNLLYIWYNSVGGNSLLLLNVPPDTRGRIHGADADRLAKIGKTLRKHFSKPINCAYEVGDCAIDNPASNLVCDDDSYCTVNDISDTYTVMMTLDKEETVDKVVLKEQCDFSQRIENAYIEVLKGKKWVKVCNVTTVGFCRIATFKPVKCSAIRLTITSCRLQPYLSYVMPYAYNGKVPRAPWYRNIVAFFHKINYAIYIARENRHKQRLERKNKKQA